MGIQQSSYALSTVHSYSLITALGNALAAYTFEVGLLVKLNCCFCPCAAWAEEPTRMEYIHDKRRQKDHDTIHYNCMRSKRQRACGGGL